MRILRLTILLIVVLVSLGVETNPVLPRLGLGTAGLREKTQFVVTTALSQGVRLIDTAQAQEWYDEKSVADAFRAQPLAFAPIVVTKVHPRSFEREAMRRALALSAKNFEGIGLHTVLLHSPYCWPGHCTAQQEKVHWSTAWRNLEGLQAEFDIEAIGVSNFDVDQLTELLQHVAHSGRVAVIQNWMDPFHQDRAVRALARAHGVQYMAYSSFGTQWSSRGYNPVLESQVLRDIADKHQCSVAKVVLAWLLQEGVVAIPRTSNADHVVDNFDWCKDEEMSALCSGETDVDLVETFLTADDFEAIRALDGTLGVPWE